jgi:hypothetical protein
LLQQLVVLVCREQRSALSTAHAATHQLDLIDEEAIGAIGLHEAGVGSDRLVELGDGECALFERDGSRADRLRLPR